MKKLQIFSWCLYDFANSSYSAVIATVVFPVYYVNAIVGNEAGLGDMWWGRAIALSMAAVAVTSPFAGGMAGYGGLRKTLLAAYTLMCVACVALFSTLGHGMVLEGFMLVFLANVGMEGALVFYNSFLNDIAGDDHRGRVSAWGFGLGYAGSIAALLIALPLVKAGAYSALWPTVAVFFLVFSLPAFLFLPGDEKRSGLRRAALGGFTHTVKNLRVLWRRKSVRRFLTAYFIYEDGVNTVIVFSGIFAATTLGYSQEELIYIFLAVQSSALAGAFLMARPIDRWGARNVVMLSLVMWSVVTVASYFIYSKWAFAAVAATAGLGLGTVQAASRALFAGFIPRGMESEYFGVYSLLGKTSSIIGPVMFGALSAYFSSQRPAILAVTAFFAVGLAILFTVDGSGDAGNT